MDKAALISKAIASRKKKQPVGTVPSNYKEKAEAGQVAYKGGKKTPQTKPVLAGAPIWKRGKK